MEQMTFPALSSGEPPFIAEVGLPLSASPRKRLIDHDGIEELSMTVALRVADGHLAVVQCDAVLALDANAF